jgi:hypothetical protein
VLPTLSSNASQIMSKIESALAALQTIDFQKVTDHFSDLLDNGSKRVAAIPFGAYNDKIISALNSVANFDAPYWDNRVHVFLASLIRYDHLSDTWDGQLFRNSGNLIGLGQNTRARIATFGRALLNLREQLQNGGEFRTGLDNSLKTVNALATSLNNRATALAQNPRVVTP